MGYIYKIENLINHKCYIGQTKKTIQERYKEHIYSSKSKKSKIASKVLYKAMRKYGLENFEVTLLEECSDDDLNNREIYWIDKFDSYRNGYNSTIGGDGIRKPLPSYEEVLQYYTDNHNISLTQTAEHFDLCPSTIHDILVRGGFSEIRSHPQKRSYKKSPLYNYKEIADKYQELKNAKQTAVLFGCSEEVVKRACKECNVEMLTTGQYRKEYEVNTVYQIDKNTGEIIQSFRNLKEAARFLGNEMYSSNIGACCNGKQKTAYGYRWTYDKENYSRTYVANSKQKPVLQFDIKTLEIINEFPSVADASESICGIRENNVSSSIAACARNEFFSCYGYSWLYKDLYEQGETKERWLV